MSEFYELIPVTDVPTTVIVGSSDQPCLTCGKPTRFIDYCAEAPFCSKTCQDKFYDEISEQEEC
ncbi:MAG: hypothetical protein NC489_16625 [Ruminococcus flavefaciens]|nr:hypothetical protein [Ruminococcus flavefaciens]